MMVIRRGRPRKVIPKHPNRVISIAMRRGLSATLELQRDIKTKDTVHLHRSSQEVWKGAMTAYQMTKRKGNADHSFVAKAEHTLRSNLLSMLQEKAAAYGNREVVRVRRSDETIGPLNQQLNVCGAALREFAMTMYPFPDPDFFGHRTRKVDGKMTTFRIMGYRRNSLGPYTPLIHADLPSLEFADAIRHHLDYLATFCYIYDVPLRETRRYWNLYQLRARPYLDYIYSECSVGEKRFREGTRKILREIKECIQSHHSTRRGDKPTVTKSLSFNKPTISSNVFDRLILEAESMQITDPSLNELKRILVEGCSPHDEVEPCLRDQDAEYLWQRLSERSSKVGSRIHRQLSSQLQSPWSLRRVILYGDSLGSPDEYILCLELSLDTPLGEGKSDIVLFKRVASPKGTHVFWCPVMVLEIKTRAGYTFHITTEDIASEVKPTRTVADFIVNARRMDEAEWDAIIRAKPDKSIQKQLKAYAKALWDEYQSVTGTERLNPIITGTLFVEAMEDIRLVRDLVRSFTVDAYEQIIGHSDLSHRLLIRLKGTEDTVRLALVINKHAPRIEMTDALALSAWSPVYDPLQLSMTKDQRFILYLDGKSQASSGTSAGWIAKYYHGLHLVRNLIEENSPSSVVWLDLANQFIDPGLAEARLRLRPYSKNQRDSFRSHNREYEVLFHSIKIRGLFQAVDKYLFRNGSLATLQKQLKDLPRKDVLIIVSGMETIQKSTPQPYRWRLSLLQSGILSILPEDPSCTVLWFDSPVPGVSFSTAYSGRVLLPYYASSSLNGVVTEIVWNLPVAPGCEVDPRRRGFIPFAKTPFHDDIRVIVTQRMTGFLIESTLVPTLTDWSKRFAAQGLGKVTSKTRVEQKVPDRKTRARMEILTLTLIPWLVNIWPTQKLDENHGFQMVGQRYESVACEYQIPRESVALSVEQLRGPSNKEPTLFDRLRYQPPTTPAGKSVITVSEGSINSQRLYRGLRELKTKPSKLYQETRPVVDDEINLSDVRFGIALSSEEYDYMWRAIIDPSATGGVQVGLFPNSLEGGMMEWSVNRLDIVREIGSDIDVFNQKVEYVFWCCSDVEPPRWLVWEKSTSEADWTLVGTHNHVYRTSGSPVALRAFQIIPDLDVVEQIFPKVVFPDGMREIIRWSVQDTTRKLSNVRRVRIRLEEQGNMCRIRFQDPETGDTLHTLSISSSAEIVKILRWPMTQGTPLRLREDLSVTWSPFHDFSRMQPDIDFGEFSFLQDVVHSTLSVYDGEPLSPLITDSLSALGMIRIVIYHDLSCCPIADDPVGVHGSCWRMEMPSDIPQVSAGPLKDTQILQTINALAESVGEERIRLVFRHGRDAADRLVFNESKVMRELSRKYRGVPLQRFEPGHTTRIRVMRGMKRESDE